MAAAGRRSSVYACAAAGWLALGASACGGAGAADAFCELGAEHEIARTSAKDFDAIDVVALRGGAVALWSTASGLFARALDATGLPKGEPQRVGVRCAGGFDAIADGDGLTVACLLHPTHGKHEEPGGLLLHALDSALHVTRTRLLGSAGPQSEGVALARDRTGLHAAWHDGAPDAHRIMWASLAASAPPPRAVSELGRMAQAPALAAIGERTVVTWAENWLDGGELASRLVIWDGRSPPRTLLPRAHVAAMPQLFQLGAGLALGYRDRTSPTAKTGLYLAKVAGAQGGLGPAVRVGRADGVGRPALQPCMHGVVAATPRTYGGDYFVGINWLDDALGRSRGEQQFYEDAHAFTQVSAACLGAHALLLIAEFPQLQRDTTALRAAPYACR